jgi:hypothetical protein
VFEEIGEPFGPVGGVSWRSSRHRPRDEGEFALDGGPESPGSALDQRIEAHHRLVETLEGRGERTGALSELIEVDHLCHADIMSRGSDTTHGRSPQATRTLLTGASRSWTENQVAPASAEPNTSPLVAPKYSCIDGPSPAEPKA